MKTLLFRFLFSLSSFSGILLFLVINRNTGVPYVEMPNVTNISPVVFFFIKYLIILFNIILFAKFVLWLSEKILEKSDNIQVKKIKPAEGIFLPIYIGLFVIALSFSDGFSVQTCFLILFLFVLWLLFENVSYFNPFFLFCGYRFYEIESDNNLTVMIITKRKDLKKIERFTNLTRINNFTFLEYSYE